MAQVGDTAEDDQVFRLTFDGQVVEEHDVAVMGGAAESVTKYLEERYTQGLSRDEALKLAAAALGHSETGHRDIPARDLEVAVLDRTRSQERKFKRLDDKALAGILAGPESTAETPGPTHRAPEGADDTTSNGTPDGAAQDNGAAGPEDEPPVAP